ncbi:MAG: hypothetical protein WEE89_16920 [Gemmatimonadota bacterium]
MIDTLTIVLDGRVTLSDFAEAVKHVSRLLGSLGGELAPGVGIEWEIDNLQSGSAIASVKGIGPAPAVDAVITAYEKVGAALGHGQPIPFSPNVQKEAKSLVSLINGNISAIRFETERVDYIVRGASLAPVSVPQFVSPEDTYGAVEGEIDTLSRRRGLRFTLYDSLSDHAVSCYLAPGYEEVMRNAWGKRAIVMGRVKRDPLTGKPLSVRRVTAVEVINPRKPGDWKLARGASSAIKGDPLPEDSIRKSRDAR